MGKGVSREDFARICLALEERGAENINIVTGSHAIPALVAGIRHARSQGLARPVLWNSSAYESLEGLSLLNDTVDVYLPDLKTLDSALGLRFFNAPDYPVHAQRAIQYMMETRQLRFKPSRGAVGEPGSPSDVLVSGVIIRHLVLPDYLEATKEALRWFAEHGRNRALLSIMTQYTPIGRNAAKKEPQPGQGRLDRYIHEKEYEQVLQWLEEFAIEEGFYQELTPDTSWLPDFNQYNPFASELSTPVWHWKKGFVC
jgi:putative pyruvate formate lyase activating enzyme